MSSTSIFPLFLTKKGPTVKAVQKVLQRIGEASTGTKDVVQNRLLAKVTCRKIPHTVSPRGNGGERGARILSIDMGIKNLAYCVADVEKPTSTRVTTNMDFLTWRRLDLIEAFREYDGDSLDGGVGGSPKKAVLEGRDDDDLYTPENLSRMGYRFLRKALDDWNPDVILIERQRWRSAGSPTIQQWTVRVNTLEAVMWAVMTALKNERKKDFAWRMHAVDPKRVGHFWLDGTTPLPPSPQTSKKTTSRRKKDLKDDEPPTNEADQEEQSHTKKLTRGKAEKKAKINLLRTWLDSEHPSTAPSPSATATPDFPCPAISFTFSHQDGSDPPSHGADGTRQALLYATDSPSQKAQRTRYCKAYVKKVDDITDCFLQAAAWVAWDENLASLAPEVDALMAQVEEVLGRKVNGGLAGGVKMIQGTADGVDETKKGKGVVKKVSRRKNANAEGGEAAVKARVSVEGPRARRKAVATREIGC